MGGEKLRADSFKEDLNFLYAALLNHPSMYRDPQIKRNFIQLYQSKEDKVCSYDSLVNAATELTVFFMDGHTNIEVPYSAQDFCIPLCLRWDECESGLLLGKSYDEIPANAKIISVNGKTVEDLISLMSKRIPHENLYLVKSRMIMYPYRNYHLFSEMSLNYLFGVKDGYDISFSVNGERIEKRCYLINYNGFLDFPDDSEFISYEIHDNKMILHLNACIFNEQYKRTLETAAKLCRDRNITLFILDLSRNMGGNSAVIDEFITYTNADSFKRYEMIDYSSGEARQITNRQEFVINKRKPICFPDNIFCKVSCNTFSSARTFAVTLKDNGIAKIIGAETGGKPNSYGMPKRLQMPGSNLHFRVSTSYFMRPDKSKDDAITLETDKVDENGK